MTRKLVGLMLMWRVGYDGYTNMYENRNVHLYFINFFMYHMAVILHHFLYRHKRKSGASIEPSIPNFLICGVHHKECSLVVTLYCVIRQPKHMPHQDLCPTNATQPAPGLAAANRGRDGTRLHRRLIGIGLCGIAFIQYISIDVLLSVR